MIRRLLLASIACLATLGSLAGCGSDSGKVVVGVILPMSGAQATYGEESWNGMQLALEDLQTGGAKLPFELVLQDEKSEPTEAESRAKTLIEVNGARALIGSVASSNTKKIGTVVKAAGVPCITPASTNDQLTPGNPYLSRICYKDSFQGTVLANFALENGWKKAAVIIDKESDYSLGLSSNFKTRFEAQGGTAHDEFFKAGNPDFSNVIQGVADFAPDVVFFSGYYEDGGAMIKQAQGRWGQLPVIGGDGIDSDTFIQLVASASNPIYFTTHFAPDAPDDRVQAFAKRYEEKFGSAPGAMAALGYDVLFVMSDAVQRAGEAPSAEALAKAIAATKGLKGITGSISLDNDERTPVKDVVIVRVEAGAKKYHATINP